MKRKSRRDIPDFSSKGPKSRLPERVKQEKPATVSAPRVKPQATSAKSGRRGA